MTRNETARRHTRYDVQGVEGTFLFNLEVDVQNLSVAGMAVQTTRALNVGRRYVFTINRNGEALRVSGRVAWCVLGATRSSGEGDSAPVYHAGIQFQDVLTDAAQGILHVIEENVVLDLDERIFGRFRLNSDAAVSVDAGVEFGIRRISLSGMLAEAETEVGNLARMEAVFPLEIPFEHGVFSCGGRIAYVNQLLGKGSEEDRVQLGVEFVDVAADQRKVLESFIASIVESAAGDVPEKHDA